MNIVLKVFRGNGVCLAKCSWASFSLRALLLRNITTRGRFYIEEQNYLVHILGDACLLIA